MDIGNAYLKALTSKIVYIRAGPEYGALADHLLLIYKALYGLNSSKTQWHKKLSDVLKKESFEPCLPSQTYGCIRMETNMNNLSFMLMTLHLLLKFPKPLLTS